MSALTYRIIAARRTERRNYRPPETTYPPVTQFDRIRPALIEIGKAFTRFSTAAQEAMRAARDNQSAWENAATDKHTPPFWTVPPGKGPR